uniref:Uncharacterized protein n=1 Tax=Arundo donax TaxID=35708 RepID=A0A0A9FDN4_ARUDO
MELTHQEQQINMYYHQEKISIQPVTKMHIVSL